MQPASGARAPHPCLQRDCGHPPDSHVATPELAGPFETVVWCTACRQHETLRPRRWSAWGGRGGSRGRHRLARGAN